MSKEAVIVLLIGATLTGCVTPQQAPMRRISQPFDAEQARGLVAVGTSTLRGSAFLRQQGGGVVTCAGSDVTLVPATEYAKHRLTALYGSQLYMSTGVARGEAMQFDPDPPEYRTLTLKEHFSLIEWQPGSSTS
jgi:hypothetical protein